jgi:predicted metal-dependent hydrolase
MRFLANDNFPLNAVEALHQQEHDVVWIRTESPGISDTEVLSRAQANVIAAMENMQNAQNQDWQH